MMHKVHRLHTFDLAAIFFSNQTYRRLPSCSGSEPTRENSIP